VKKGRRSTVEHYTIARHPAAWMDGGQTSPSQKQKSRIVSEREKLEDRLQARFYHIHLTSEDLTGLGKGRG